MRECRASVFDQKFSGSYEVIVIDDSSDDGSFDIAQEYYFVSPEKITILRKENAGVSAVRNAGIDAITGRFFLFLDADDQLPQNSIQQLYDAAVWSEADIVKRNMKIRKGNRL